jgi:hypothetical protein
MGKIKPGNISDAIHVECELVFVVHYNITTNLAIQDLYLNLANTSKQSVCTTSLMPNKKD